MAVKQLLGMFLVFALNIWISAAAEEASTDSDAPPYTFVKGQPGKASQINDNFKGIYQRVGELERKLSDFERRLTPIQVDIDCDEKEDDNKAIQAALDLATAKGSVVNLTGICREVAVVIKNDGITVAGKAGGGTRLIGKPSSVSNLDGPTSAVVLIAGAEDAKLMNLTFEEAPYGLYIDNNSTAEVLDSKAINNEKRGFFSYYNTFLQCVNCEAVNNDDGFLIVGRGQFCGQIAAHQNKGRGIQVTNQGHLSTFGTICQSRGYEETALTLTENNVGLYVSDNGHFAGFAGPITIRDSKTHAIQVTRNSSFALRGLNVFVPTDRQDEHSVSVGWSSHGMILNGGAEMESLQGVINAGINSSIYVGAIYPTAPELGCYLNSTVLAGEDSCVE